MSALIEFVSLTLNTFATILDLQKVPPVIDNEL